MQLNPARGRKLELAIFSSPNLLSKVYAAQPREGTETLTELWADRMTSSKRFMQLNPARGRKLADVGGIHAVPILVYAAQPREGTET